MKPDDRKQVLWNKDVYVFTKEEFTHFIEWLRVNGERHRGNLQKNGVELYKQYLIEHNKNPVP